MNSVVIGSSAHATNSHAVAIGGAISGESSSRWQIDQILSGHTKVSSVMNFRNRTFETGDLVKMIFFEKKESRSALVIVLGGFKMLSSVHSMLFVVANVDKDVSGGILHPGIDWLSFDLIKSLEIVEA